MNFVAAKCPNCGADIQVDQTKKEAFCQYCGLKLLVDEAIHKYKVEFSGSLEIDGKVRIINQEFESKLANANYWAKVYFRQGPDYVRYGEKTGYDAVMGFYSDAERIGSNESIYWASLARFYSKAHLESIKVKKVLIIPKRIFKDNYVLWMEEAIEKASANDKTGLEKETSEMIERINKEVATVRDAKDIEAEVRAKEKAKAMAEASKKAVSDAFGKLIALGIFVLIVYLFIKYVL